MIHAPSARLVRCLSGTTAGVLLTTGAVLALPVSAQAATATLAAPAAASATPFTASASSAFVHVQALTATPGADLVLSPATVSADSSKGPGASMADGANLDALVLGTLSLNNVLSDVSQASIPGQSQTPASGQLLAVTAAPLATVGVGTADASAADISNGACPSAGAYIASSDTEIASASVLPNLSMVGDGVDVNQTVRSSSTTQLSAVSGQTGQAVTSIATSSLTSLSLLGGSVQVSVAHAPILTAVATGTPGESSVTYSSPVVTVTIGNGTPQTLSTPGQSITIPNLGTLSLGTLTKTVSADGTTATGSAALLHLDVAPNGTNVATVDLVPETAAATVPSGGVLCGGGGQPVITPSPTPSPAPDPFSDFRKGLSATTVNAGRSFSSPVVLSNRASCTIDDATVTDVVKGNLKLQDSSPSPSATASGSYTYGPFTLAPGQVLTVSQTFGVPSGATTGTTYGDTATVSGTCDGSKTTGTSTVTGPTVDAPGPGSCNLSRSNLISDHLQVTGGEEFDDITNLFNTGGANCTDVIATETLPAGTSFVSCTGGCTLKGNVVTWSVGTLAPGGSRSLTVTLKAPAAQAPGAAPRVLVGAGTATANGGVKVELLTEKPALTGTSVLGPLTPASRANGTSTVKAAEANRSAKTGKPAKAVKAANAAKSKVTQPAQVLAYTGMPDIGLPALLILLLAGGGTLLRRRMNRLT